MTQPTFRQATAADSDLLADMVFGGPEAEGRRVSAALLGVADSERLRPLLRKAARDAETWRRSEILLIEGRPAGMRQTGDPPFRISPGLAFTALRSLGVLRVLRLPSRLKLLARVTPKMPDGAYVISELNVVEEQRGHGLGRAMMDRAEADARARGFALIALHTRITNPARRLYERCGFEATQELRDAEFERITGVPGNVLYVKHLS